MAEKPSKEKTKSPAGKMHRAWNVMSVTIKGVDLFFVALKNNLATQF